MDNTDYFQCKTASKKSCCGSKNPLKKFDKADESISDECHKEVAEKFINSTQTAKQDAKPDLFSSEAVKITKKKIFCLGECIGKKKLLLNDDGSLNKTAISEFALNDLFKEDWQKNIGQKALSKCLEEIYTPWPKDDTENKCNPVYVQFVHCMWLEYETNCPANHRKSSKKCNKIRRRYRMDTSSSENVSSSSS
uniref:Odorant binding protein 5 n=2 Tax=Daktulosphaira vitifoliae TaxID=58002 RepID=A0A1W6R6G0_DAKVI|nr:odorant binding protein 5 [Daktulosphaira vitifoliae]